MRRRTHQLLTLLPPSLPPDDHIVSLMDVLDGSPLYLETESLGIVLRSVANQLSRRSRCSKEEGRGVRI